MTPWFLVWTGPVILICGVTAALLWKRWWRTERPESYPNRGSLGLVAGALTVATVLSTLVLVIGTGVAWGDQIACKNEAANREVEYRWSLSAGCFFHIEDRWIARGDQVTINGGV